MAAAEGVERRGTAAAPVAMEEPALLAPVDRIVGGIEIPRDLLGRPGMGLQKQIDEQASQSPGSCPIL